MKKYILILAAFLALNATTHAQAVKTPAKVTPSKTVVKPKTTTAVKPAHATTAPVVKTNQKKVVSTNEKTTTKPTAVSNNTKPVNGITKASNTHLKKDGTPDKRYKSSQIHLKKDGTPDQRYKENKKKV